MYNSMSKSMETNTTSLLIFSFVFYLLILLSDAVDTLAANQTIVDDGNTTIVSSDGMFELGFFSPGRSKNRYIGIWYKKISNGTVVWVANRNDPLNTTLGVFKVSDIGNLELTDASGSKIWSSNSSRSTKDPVVAQLLTTGNFVVRYADNSDSGNYLWQSFDYPTDNLLPGMKLGWNFAKGLDRYLRSWKSADDPSPGIYSERIILSGYPQLLLLSGSETLYRYGPWDGTQFSGLRLIQPYLSFEVKLITTNEELYADFVLDDNSTIAVRFALQPNGTIQLLTYTESTKSWTYGNSPNLDTWFDDCDSYAICGAYGSCNITQVQAGKQACECLGGYSPRFPERWKVGNWSGGCVPKPQFACDNGSDVFVKYPGNLKLPDTRNSWYNRTMGLDECKERCTNNCSCTAYSNVDIRQGGTGCLLWFNELLDLRNNKVNGLDLYVRTAASGSVQENTSTKNSKKVSTGVILIITILGVAVLLLVGLFMIVVYKKRRQRRRGRLAINNLKGDVRNETEREDWDLPLFDFNIIAKATDDFAMKNKIGEGGFGPVYRGKLDEGQEIAVKRLSKTSNQGLHEFKNELSFIAKLQHRNLVRLLGCCIEEGEMLLIYEYMPNKSLDSFIFDKRLRLKLDWPMRFNIINGTAKGLMYLHQDSRLRIIHRDLKAGNILLDHDMSPRISDFGLARTFGGTESGVNTARVVGTYGYMSPEYAIDGLFSVKSDAYSFGVVILEIVSGKRVREFSHSENDLNLLGYAWKLFKEGKIMDLVDESIVETCNVSEVHRAIHIGLLCVQPYPKDRPNMSFIVSMLGNEAELPEPKEPGLFSEMRAHDSDTSSGKQPLILYDELMFTSFGPR